MGLGRDLRHARSLPLRTWADLATAAAELALARIRVMLRGADGLIGTDAAMAGTDASGAEIGRTIDRVAFAIPRMGARVPWRSTCLVQALAARHWLGRKGIRSSIRLGARKPPGEALDAHAWLEVDGRLVVGGEVTGYSRFTPPRRD